MRGTNTPSTRFSATHGSSAVPMTRVTRPRNTEASFARQRYAKTIDAPKSPKMPPDAPTEIACERRALAIDPARPESKKIARSFQGP